MFCLFFSPGITCELVLNKCSGVTAPLWEWHSKPIVPCSSMQMTLEGLLERGREGGAENVNEIYSLSSHFGENMYINATSAEKNPPETFGDSK